MELAYLNDMVNGWFIGDFEPSLLKTKDFEVAIKVYQAGDYEEHHYHKKATEYTIVLNGEVFMNETRYKHGDIIIMKPGETTDFKAITNVTTVVVKTPSAQNDKFWIV